MDKTCCFSGHRKMSQQNIGQDLENAIEYLITEEGVKTFISGGALGFDTLAAFSVISKRDTYDIKLVLALPCKEQDKFWTAAEKAEYKRLLKLADSVVYVSEAYTPDCMKKRNQYMVDQSQFCICFLENNRSGTGQTVRYAKEKGLQIIRVC